MTMMRCPVVRIAKVTKHPNADSLDIINILGYQCVDRCGSWSENQFAVYIPIDSLVNSDRQEFSFLKRPDKNNIVRVKTVKLRGVVSQGILVEAVVGRAEGEDCSDFYNVEKYEPIESCPNPYSKSLGGDPKGNFPSHLPKTDVERWQNYPTIFHKFKDKVHIATEKVEGSSSTCFLKCYDGETVHFGVCSRNLELKPGEGNNAFWSSAIKFDIEKKLKRIAMMLSISDKDIDIAVQGELTGPGIQSNIYKHKEFQFYAFDLLINGQYVPSNRFFELCKLVDIQTVPIVYTGEILPDEKMVEFATDQSQIYGGTLREGLVWKLFESEESDVEIGRVQLKVISPEYLLKKRSD